MKTFGVYLGAAVLMICLAAVAVAEPLTLRHVTAAEAAARLGAKYGVDITLQGHFDHYITFSIDEADTEGGRLLAVNALANAIGADFNKSYIITKVSDGPVVPPTIDTTASMPFPRTTYSAKDAIAMVIGLDDATVQDASDASGVVTLSSPTLTVAQAAQQIAAQTHTHWQTVYALTPRIRGRVPGGTVIGRTVGGSAIIELASVYYHDAKWQARQQQIAATEQQAEADELAAEQQAAQAAQLAAQQGVANSPAATGSTSGGYGYGSPYQYGGNYSGNGGGYNPGSGLIITGNTYNGTSPVYFGPGSY